MKINIRNLFLKSLPYLMSIAGGIVLYTGAIDNAPNDNLRDLVINVSASLLSIPLVFLLYDYTNSRIASQMSKHLSANITDKLNSIMLGLVDLLRSMMNVRGKLTLDSLNKMLIMRASAISGRLNIRPSYIEDMRTLHNDLDQILYRSGTSNVLTTTQVQVLTSLAREMLHLINENKFRGNKKLSAHYIENIMTKITDWLESDAVAGLLMAQHLAENPGENTADNKKAYKK